VLEKHLEDFVTEELLDLFHVDFGKDMEGAVGHQAAVADQAMEMRVKIDQIPKGLDGDHGSGYAFLLIEGGAEELLETLVGALAELSQKSSIKSKWRKRSRSNLYR